MRRLDRRGVPPISTLLESADIASTPRPLSSPGLDAHLTELEELRAQRRDLSREITHFYNVYDGGLLHGASARPAANRTYAASSHLAEQDGEERDATIHRAFGRLTRSPSPIAPRPSGRESPSAPRSTRLDSHAERRGRNDAIAAFIRNTSEGPRAHAASNDLDGLAEQHVRRVHPMARSRRAESPIGGLGDRDRSPLSAGGWEVMRSTITPDTNLPSAESSFASAVASGVFSAGTTNAGEHERSSTSETSRRSSEEEANAGDSVSSVDADDLVCSEEEREATAAFALDFYTGASLTEQGTRRIAEHRAAHSLEGDRFVLSGEGEQIEIGFRLINEALDSPEGHRRLLQLSESRRRSVPDEAGLEAWISADRRDGARSTTRADLNSLREGTEILEHYLARSVAGEPSSLSARRWRSPPPRYEAPASLPDGEAFTSLDEPEPHPVSRPSSRGQRGIGAMLFDDELQDLDGVRRIVERLAQREDIPDDWWTSVGLARHLRRTRPRLLSTEPGRVRSGRVERGNQTSRL